MTRSTTRPLTTVRPQKSPKLEHKQVRFHPNLPKHERKSWTSIFNHSYVISVPLASLFLYLFQHYLRFLDMDKRVYNHVPGECSFVGGLEKGAVDLAWLNNETVIISTGSDLNNASNATAGALSVWRVNDGMANELSFSGKTPPTFNPYGISVFASTIFVINSRRGRVETDSVEVLEIKDGRLRRKRKPVASKHFTSLVNVVGLSSTEFYASNQYIYRNPYMQWIEFGGHFKSGAVYYFDGRLIHPAIKKLKQPAGMARDGSKLYVAEFGGNAIQIYDINDFKTPHHLETINLPSAPFSIAMELRQSALTVSTHPLKLRFLAFQAYPEEFLSPSNVIRVKQRKNKTWQFTQFYCNDGATIRGVVTAMRIPDNRIVMGNVNRGLLKCQLNLT